MLKVQLNDLPKSETPFLNHCRVLTEQGVKKGTRLEMYQGEVLSLATNDIPGSAKLAVRDSGFGPKFVKYVPFDEKARARLRIE